MAPRRLKSAVTLKDIAGRVGVSAMTVSLALRDSPAVTEATRERVRKAAMALGYLPNMFARAFVEKRNPTIGVIVHDLSYPFFVPIIRQIQEAADAAGFLVVLAETKRALSAEREMVNRLRQFRVMGIAVHPATRSYDHLHEARQDGTPVISFARRWRGGDSIAVDNIAGGAVAARHLLKRGFNQIGLISSSDPDNLPLLEREEGFITALSNQNVMIPSRWRLVAPGTDFEDGQRAAELLISQGAPPKAIFCVNDRLSLGFINRSRQLGVRVPEEVSVVGFDDIAFAAYSEVSLTTIALPADRIGKHVAKLLFARIAGRGPSEAVQLALKPELIVRHSSP